MAAATSLPVHLTEQQRYSGTVRWLAVSQSVRLAVCGVQCQACSSVAKKMTHSGKGRKGDGKGSAQGTEIESNCVIWVLLMVVVVIALYRINCNL